MTTASDTSVPADVEPAATATVPVRDWCCGTAITDPHADGCASAPREDAPVDYGGPVVVVEPAQPAAEPEPEADPAKWVHQGEWEHQWMDFMGDRLAVRTPRESVVNAVIMLRSPLVSEDERGNVMASIIKTHLSPESWGRVQFRSISPDEDEYTMNTVGELLEALLDLALKAAGIDQSAAAAAE